MLKRVGMLAASAAVCGAVAGGGLMMQGMRYVRPTAENWSLLPYAEPAAKVEQTVGRSSKGEEFSRDYVSLTGYDEQGREIWKKSRFSTDPGLRSEHKTYDGDTVAWHTITNGTKADVYQQYDAQGRLIREESGNLITVYSHRGDETEPYLTEMHTAEGVLRLRGTAEIDPKTGERTENITVYDANGIAGSGHTTMPRIPRPARIPTARSIIISLTSRGECSARNLRTRTAICGKFKKRNTPMLPDRELFPGTPVKQGKEPFPVRR